MLFQRATTVLQPEKRLTCSTDTNFGWFCYQLFKQTNKKKTYAGKKCQVRFFYYLFIYLFIYFLAKRTALQKSNKIYFPVGSVLRASSFPNVQSLVGLPVPDLLGFISLLVFFASSTPDGSPGNE